jgi:hypothetical protein
VLVVAVEIADARRRRVGGVDVVKSRLDRSKLIFRTTNLFFFVFLLFLLTSSSSLSSFLWPSSFSRLSPGPSSVRLSWRSRSWSPSRPFPPCGQPIGPLSA